MRMNTYTETLNDAAKKAGGFEALGRACKLTGKAIKKWAELGRPPRTEYTGETHYAQIISAFVDGAVTVEDLLPDISQPPPLQPQPNKQ